MNRRSLLGGGGAGGDDHSGHPSVESVSRPAPQATTFPCRSSPL